MKLITAIAALALLAGSMDADAQRGKANVERAERGVEEDGIHPNPLSLIAIVAFGEMDEETQAEIDRLFGMLQDQLSA